MQLAPVLLQACREHRIQRDRRGVEQMKCHLCGGKMTTEYIEAPGSKLIIAIRTVCACGWKSSIKNLPKTRKELSN